ncbi:MAG: sigma-70 family RNA polymerase sigma factor [Myxococcales bacterium]|nr:sigma-70 family RNA polymerase sigma factor [Myxococcales bacterium]
MLAPTRHRLDGDRVAAAIAGDTEAMDAVVQAWLPTVFRWCARLGGGRIDSEEAAQEVLITLVRRRHTIARSDRLPGWLFGACRRIVANHRRRAWFKRWAPGVSVDQGQVSPAIDEQLERCQLAASVHAVLDRLSERHRAVLLLCFIEERSVSEASELLDVPMGTVKSRLHHAKARFQYFYERRTP